MIWEELDLYSSLLVSGRNETRHNKGTLYDFLSIKIMLPLLLS